MSVTLNILQGYFPIVRNLREYLQDTLQGLHDAVLVSDDDDPVYQELLKTAYVGARAACSVACAPTLLTDIQEASVIERSQVLLLTRRISDHVITQGYRLARSDDDEAISGNGQMINFFVNTIVTALHAPEWSLLLQRIGIDPMLHLFTETTLFVSLPNGCLCQMTGPIIINVVPKVYLEKETALAKETQCVKRKRSSDEPGSDRLQKHLKPGPSSTGRKNVSLQTHLRSPVGISFERQRIFYARPSFIEDTKQIVIGLPSNHILNRLQSSLPSRSSENHVESDDQVQAQHSRHLSKYIFPRQYGLSSAFTPKVSRWSKVPDREVEITRLGRTKTPKRLRSVLLALDKLVWRHGKCKYKLLRDWACPSKVVLPEKTMDETVILEMMSEDVSQFRSQNFSKNDSFDSSGNTILPLGSTQARQATKNKPRFAEFACDHHAVYKYVVLVTKAVIPKRIWGSEANFRVVCQHIKTFIESRRFETLTVHGVLQGFSTSDCEWLMPPGDGNKRSRVTVSDSLKRRELLEDFLFWFFDSFVISLLRTTFFVTDTSAFRNKVLYFRLDDWEMLCAPLIDRLTTGTFEKLQEADAMEILRQRELGFSFVRLLPKETGVRPIVNLRRKQPSNTGSNSGPRNQSINQILQAAFSILNYEKEAQSHRIGASTSGDDDVYAKLRQFKTSLGSMSNGKLPKLYFVKMDVQACFDTIDQQKLLEILCTLISQDAYMIQKFGQISTAASRTKRFYSKKAIPDDDHPHFLQHAAELAKSLRNIIFSDQVKYSSAQKQGVLALLEQHITENIVKIGNEYYRQVIGIPQGSVLSSILCAFFYGDLENSKGDFPKISEDPRSLLMRHTDDYLLITADLLKAKSFLKMMNKGHPEYGCFVSQDKTMTNFDHDENVLDSISPQEESFPWCGYSISMTDLSVAVDYTRYHTSHLRDSLTIDRGRSSGRAFLNKMLWLAKRRFHVIYTDSTLNSEYVVHLNIYQNFLLSAMKMDAYLRDWGALKRRQTDKLIKDTVNQMFNYCYSAMRNKANRVRCDFKIQRADVLWLGAHAFHKVVSGRRQKYSLLLKWLSFNMVVGKNRGRHRKFRRVITEGFACLSHIEF